MVLQLKLDLKNENKKKWIFQKIVGLEKFGGNDWESDKPFWASDHKQKLKSFHC